MEQRINCRQSILRVAEIAAAAYEEQPDQYDKEDWSAIMAATNSAFCISGEDTVLLHVKEDFLA